MPSPRAGHDGLCQPPPRNSVAPAPAPPRIGGIAYRVTLCISLRMATTGRGRSLALVRINGGSRVICWWLKLPPAPVVRGAQLIGNSLHG